MVNKNDYAEAARSEAEPRTLTITIDPDLAARIDRARRIDGFLPRKFIREQLDAVLTMLESDRG